MHRRIKSITVATGALVVLALGGSALATASSPSTTSSPAAAVTPEKTPAADPGPAVQQGDQTTPDRSAAAPKEVTDAQADPSGPNDTKSPDNRSAAPESAAENTSENASETGPSDGPGGFADAGSSADTQQQGEH
jgi:hypothetical protein